MPRAPRATTFLIAVLTLPSALFAAAAPAASIVASRPVKESPVSLKDLPPFKLTPEQHVALETRKAWFRDARFGMFIHWGPYAFTPMGEASSARGLLMPDEEFESRRLSPSLSFSRRTDPIHSVTSPS